MIKYLFIVINSLAVLIYGFFSDGVSPTVTGTFPPNIKAGQEANIELRITKGAMNGFAKLQMELPEGLAPKECENKGANYTYSGGVAKWVWASLPPESEIVIKIKLISSDETSGLKTITAKFSFVENNAKQVVEMTPGEITITPAETNTDVVAGAPPTTETTAPAVTQTTAPAVTEAPVPAALPPAAIETPASVATTSAEPAPVSTETIATVPVIVETATVPAVTTTNEKTVAATHEKPASAPVSAAPANSNAEPPGNIQVVRTLIRNNDGEYLVRIKIKKGTTKGFARYSDDLTDGLSIKALKTDGSSFSLGDGKLKFVWVNVPPKDELNLEYLITGSSANPVVLNGEYSYLEDNQSKKYKVSPETISISGGAVTSNPVKNEEAGSDTKTAATQNALSETLAKKEGDVNYHVQIGAFTSSKVDADRLKKVFHVTEAISSEMQSGFSKFMVGAHGEYKDARDHREQVKSDNGIKSAFVVAYNGSKRVTVQEALMITNQKWFK